MAVFGNVVTAWSWFGVNQLSVGLQLILCAVGLTPTRKWKSGATE